MAKVKKVRIKLNSPAIRDLLKSDAIRDDLERRAEAIRDATGSPDDFQVVVKENAGRTVVFISTKGEAGRSAEAEGRVLTRALDAGR